MTERNLEEYIKGVEKDFRLDQQGYSQEYSMINHGILEALKEKGFVKAREGGLGYDMSALNDNPEAIALAAEIGKKLAYDKVRSMFSDFDSWDSIRQEEAIYNTLGFTSDQLENTIKVRGDLFSDQAMMKDYERTIQQQLGLKKDIYMGGLRADDSKEIFNKVFNWKEGQPRWNKVKWDLLENDDKYIREAVFANIMGNKIDASYMKSQSLYQM